MQYPNEFLLRAAPTLGTPLSLEQLLQLGPSSRGLFDVGPGGGGGSVAPTTGTTPGVRQDDKGTVLGGAPGASTGQFGVFPHGQGLINEGDIAIAVQQANALREAAARGGAGAPTAPGGADTSMGLFNRAGLVNTGIGAAPTQYTGPTSVGTPDTRATAATGGLDTGDYSTLEKGLFEQAYRPAEEETNRLGKIADRDLASQLGGAGLASSGAGVGLLTRQVGERGTQLSNLAGRAATDAAVTTAGLKETELQANLNRQQQVNIQNANNVLAGNTTDAANYLATLGLNQRSAEEARSSFLQYLNINEADLARMDTNQRQNVATALNAWLQQWANLIGASRYAGTEGGSLAQSAQGGGGGGGGGGLIPSGAN